MHVFGNGMVAADGSSMSRIYGADMGLRGTLTEPSGGIGTYILDTTDIHTGRPLTIEFPAVTEFVIGANLAIAFLAGYAAGYGVTR